LYVAHEAFSLKSCIRGRTAAGLSCARKIPRSGIIDIITNTAGGVLSEEISIKIQGFRTDARLRDNTEAALKDAVEHWVNTYPDWGLVSALADDINTLDLPSVQKVIYTAALQPLNEGKTEGALTESFLGVLRGYYKEKIIQSLSSITGRNME
jgi:hypothetical protein